MLEGRRGSTHSTGQEAAAEPGCGGSAEIEMAAAELYRTAALLMGREEAALRLVEASVASIELDPCADAQAAREAAQREVIRRALVELAGAEPAAMQPLQASELGGCVDSEEAGTGISREQIERLFAAGGRARMREWLDGLGPAERSIFVLRGVLGQSGAEAATLLEEATGGRWTAAHVGGAYRSALCSLASALVHSAA
jgi:hypothetical protein